ncbi:MAG: TonB-dependent receptor [Oceanicoccus sp.]|uniref:TonB-dependent receptor domain-containing protein n=1 Tax=Oceanicoccus sp. TaxID=2691044 RepID=UPI0026249209|nr:TonB-dependent receptor [Oceanicoccus sp.]MCP3908552.1 TonB-dependent receptor [Oceanicoccus sp.]
MNKSLSLAIAVALSSNAIAETQTTERSNSKAEEIIITATRTEQSIADTLSSVTVFTREEIERFQARSLAELLSKAAGMSITSNGGRGSSTGVSLRGNQTDHTLFLVDGIRIGSSTLGSSPLEKIDPELIQRVEIVRGPKSSLYGSDAIGGVVNIITRKANSDTPLSIKGGVGNNNSNQASVSYGQRGSNYQANLTASYEYTGGYDNSETTTLPSDDNDAFRQTAIGFNGAIDINKDLNISLSYQLSESESEYDNSCSAQITFASVLCSPYSDTSTEALNLTGSLDITSNWTSILSAGKSKDESETLADNIDMLTTTSGGEFNTEKTDISWLNNIQINKELLLTIGYDFLNEEVSGTTDYDVDERDNDGYFAQLQLNHGDFSVNLGARHDDNEQFGNYETYNLAGGYAINSELKVIASYGEAFKAPTFNDLYFPNFGDPTMVPEETETYEIAVKGFNAGYNWSVSVFQNDIENLIQYNSAIFVNDQIASATIEGIEISLETEIAGWTVNTAITALDSEDDKTGNNLARRPDEILNIDIDRSFDQWSVGATFYASSSRYNDAANNSELSGYGTVALRTAYTVSDEWKLQLKADNIFEKDYVLTQASSFTGLGDYKQPGLEVLFSVVYTPKL